MTMQEDAAVAKAAAEAATMNSVVDEAARKRSEEERKAAKVAEEDQRKAEEETAGFQWRDYIQSMEMTAGKSTDSKTIQVVAAYMVDKLGLDHPEVYEGMTQADFQRLDISMLQMPAVALVRRTWATLEGARAARNQVAEEEALTIMTVQEDAAVAKAVAEAATMNSVVEEAARKQSEWTSTSPVWKSYFLLRKLSLNT